MRYATGTRLILLGNCGHWWHEATEDHPVLLSPTHCPKCEDAVEVAFVEVSAVLRADATE